MKDSYDDYPAALSNARVILSPCVESFHGVIVEGIDVFGHSYFHVSPDLP